METQQQVSANEDVKRGFWETNSGGIMQLKEQAKQKQALSLISEYNRGGFDEQERQRLLSRLGKLGVSSTDERLK